MDNTTDKTYDVPPIIYHYCSLSTFKSIIENKSIFLSDVTKSNDPNELNRFIEYLNHFHNTVEKITGKTKEKAYIDFIENHHIYSISFCKNPDKLTQWREYADDAQGIAIGFDTKQLKNLVSDIFTSTFISLKPMIYQDIYNCEFIGLHNQGFDNTGFGIVDESFFIKSNEYAHEEEYRYALIFHIKSYELIKKQMKNVGVFIRGSQLVEYFELDIAYSPQKENNLIQEIILGPCCNTDIDVVKRFINNNGFKYEMNNIYKSNISYRHY